MVKSQAVECVDSGSEERTLPAASETYEAGQAEFPSDWNYALLDSVAKRGSGHTPSKSHPEYWDGDIKWVSLQDSSELDNLYIARTAAKITAAGLANSSARLHPKGTVVLSRDAGVGKSAIITESMAVSQHFMAWQCGPELNNHFLYYWLQSRKGEFERIAVGNTIGTIGLRYFQNLRIPLPPRGEQDSTAGALADADRFIQSLERLIEKKRLIKQGAMQELLSGRRRLPGFSGEWKPIALGALGGTYGGLTGKTKQDFGHGSARYVPFMNVMTNVIVNPKALELVVLQPEENQNRVLRGDLLFNGSSETPEEVGLCSVVHADLTDTYLNSFCFGFRPFDLNRVCGTYVAYYFRSQEGRARLKSLAQGATRYNLSKRALMAVKMPFPESAEQSAISNLLMDIDNELRMLEVRLKKVRQIKQGMMQELLTGRVRFI